MPVPGQRRADCLPARSRVAADRGLRAAPPVRFARCSQGELCPASTAMLPVAGYVIRGRDGPRAATACRHRASRQPLNLQATRFVPFAFHRCRRSFFGRTGTVTTCRRRGTGQIASAGSGAVRISLCGTPYDKEAGRAVELRDRCARASRPWAFVTGGAHPRGKNRPVRLSCPGQPIRTVRYEWRRATSDDLSCHDGRSAVYP